MKKKKNNHGGARPGAGRPKKRETKVMRVPVDLVAEVEKMIERKGD